MARIGFCPPLAAVILLAGLSVACTNGDAESATAAPTKTPVEEAVAVPTEAPSIPPTTRTFYIAATEFAGGTDREPFPPPLPEGGGYVLKEPDERGRWVVEVYQYVPSQIVVNEGDTVNLEIVGTHGREHPSFIEEYVESFVVKRGQLTSLSFVADKPGTFRMVCQAHQPTMTAEIVVLPR